MRSAIITAVAAIMLAACGGDRHAVPRPEAFPRVALYDTVYHKLDSVPALFFVNDSAVVVPDDRPTDGARWVTLSYPRYNALMYLTFTPVTDATVDAVVENRLERMSLNAGSSRTELTELISDGGFSCQMFTTRSGTVTPVQFLAASPALVVSGALFLQHQPTPTSPDSLAPVINAVEADIIYALRRLK